MSNAQNIAELVALVAETGNEEAALIALEGATVKELREAFTVVIGGSTKGMRKADLFDALETAAHECYNEWSDSQVDEAPEEEATETVADVVVKLQEAVKADNASEAVQSVMERAGSELVAAAIVELVGKPSRKRAGVSKYTQIMDSLVARMKSERLLILTEDEVLSLGFPVAATKYHAQWMDTHPIGRAAIKAGLTCQLHRSKKRGTTVVLARA